MIALQAAEAATGGGLVGAEVLPVLAVGALAVATLGLAVAVARGPAHRRAYGAVGVAFPGALALAYAAVVADLPRQLGAATASTIPVARFTAYAFALLLAAWLLGRLGGAGRELTLVLAVATLGHVGGVAGWLLVDGPAALAAIGTAGVLGLVLLYLLVGAIGGAVDDDRGPCYAKLRSLLVLAWALVLATLALSPRGLGVLDGYTAALVGAYLDVVLAAGLGAVVVRSGPALDSLAGVAGGARQSGGFAPSTAGPTDGGFGSGGPGEATAVGDGGAESGGAQPGERTQSIEGGQSSEGTQSSEVSAGRGEAADAPERDEPTR